MKRSVILSWILTVGAVILNSACFQVSNNGNSAMNMNGMMNSNSMNHNSMMNSNLMNGNMMNHNGMMNNSNMSKMMDMESSPDATKQPYDTQFLDTMTHHHQGAVDMAKMVLTKSSNEELKKFAQNIITDQNKEIAQMKDWREKWYAGKPAAMNMEMPGMMDSMKMDMSKMSNLKDKEYDLAFIEMMIPHHEGAITMSKEALTKSEHAEVKQLATQIIKAQEAEIKMMKDWQTKWSK
jgi:uncharacterized protein (DUF305 family)